MKLVSILALIFSIVLLYDLKLALAGLIIAIGLLVMSRLPFRFVVNHLKWVSLFILPFFLIMPFTVPGSEIWRFSFLVATEEGLRYALLIAIKAMSAVILIFPMIGTMRFDTTLKALERLRLPNKLVQMVMFTYRYIFVFVAELQQMWRAVISRGFRVRTNMHTMRTTGKVMGTLFIRSYDRAERVYNAMGSRGYTGRVRTLDKFKIKSSDLIKAFVVIGIAIVPHCLTGVI